MHVRFTRDINAPAEVAWQILGPEFAQISEWASFVKTSRPITAAEAPSGMSIAYTAPVAGRETRTKATLQEFITAYDGDRRTLAFDAAGLPPIVTRGRNIQSVEATAGTTSRLVFDIEFNFKGPFEIFAPIVRKRMSVSLVSVMDDLKTEAERRHQHMTADDIAG